jgi:hypothetical protein
MIEHKTVPVLVWADVDEGIADVVRYLNTIPGVRTYVSCQGLLGTGGPEPYGPQVMIREPERKKEQEKRRTVGKLSPSS